jgi:small ligand-binding sensory domain FIST
MRAGVGISAAESPRAAVEEAVQTALAGGLRPDAAFLFAGAEYGDSLPELLDAAVACLGTEAVVGATGHGVLGCGLEFEGRTGISVLAHSGFDAQPFLISNVAGNEAAAGGQIAALLGESPHAEDLVVLLPDPTALQLEPMLAGIRLRLAPATIVGAAAADPLGEFPLQWCGRRRDRGGLAGMVLRGARPPRLGVTQACRPATEPMRITRTQGHWILGLDGRPALEVYREVARDPLAEDLRRAAHFLMVAIPRDAEESMRPGSYVVRHVVGFAEKEKAFAIPEPVKAGDRIALAMRDLEAARDDLKAMFAQVGTAPPALGLYFNCCARGAGFFGVPGLEAAYLEQAFGAAPIGGLFGSCEIGPIAGTAELLTYTGVLALIDS